MKDALYGQLASAQSSLDAIADAEEQRLDDRRDAAREARRRKPEERARRRQEAERRADERMERIRGVAERQSDRQRDLLAPLGSLDFDSYRAHADESPP